MTQDLLKLGRSVATDPTCHDLLIGDPPRALTNIEMHAFCLWNSDQLQQRIDRDGCCGGQMSMSGRCPETGFPCPQFIKAKRIERQVFHTKEIT